ncbi:class I SAM-dependent methyltransferase [Streptomyces purpureus]|uniref:Methyltransferase n=1 Tax=Streptomyces purpureus TaxID=1951 RepID=A0A918LUW1_9ACTN|nr:class I SAM-dependent methyltransferase [Streptomyces purpureus]GGT56931.1 methyltransferase [Streptomyces purpureus]
MSVTSRYRNAWESFWREAPDGTGAVLWDAEPSLTAGLHLGIFEPRLAEPGLPMVDLGCGNGTQTRFLAERFPRVVGVDLAPAAIERARRALPGDGGRLFRELDAVDPAAVSRLHGELGDSNVYMRGVLHQCEPQDRQALADSVALLLGEHGRAFVVELGEAAGQLLRGLAQSPDGPPPKLRPVLRHGIAPGAVDDSAVPGLFAAAGLDVLASGDLPLMTTEHTGAGDRLELPSKWLVVGRNG